LIFSTLTSINFPKAVEANPTLQTVYEENFDDEPIGRDPIGLVSISESSVLTSKINNTQSSSSPNSLRLWDNYAGSKLEVSAYLSPEISRNVGSIQCFVYLETNCSFRLSVENWQWMYHDETRTYTIIRFYKDQMKIQYYYNTWQPICPYSLNSWYNVTVEIKANNKMSIWINGTEQCASVTTYSASACIGKLRLSLGEAASEVGTVFLDNVKVIGEEIATEERFYIPNRSVQGWYRIRCDNFWIMMAREDQLQTDTTQTEIKEFWIKTKYGSWIETTAGVHGPGHSEWFYANGSQKEFSNFYPNISCDRGNYTWGCTFNFSASDQYISLWTYWRIEYDKDYVYYRTHRQYKQAWSSQQRQIDWLWLPLQVDGFFCSTQSGEFFEWGDDKWGFKEITAPNGYFPYAGYCLRQNRSVSTILTYLYDTSTLPSPCTLPQWRYQLDASGGQYNEWEVTFKGNNQASTPHLANNIEEIGLYLCYFQGNESETHNVRNFSSDLIALTQISEYSMLPVGNLKIASSTTIQNALYGGDKLNITVNATSNHQTKTLVNCGFKGAPSEVEGATSIKYNESTNILTLSVLHSGAEILMINWERPRAAVGGIVVPVDKLGLLAPHIGLASTIIVATAATAIYVKRVKHRKDKQ